MHSLNYQVLTCFVHMLRCHNVELGTHTMDCHSEKKQKQYCIRETNTSLTDLCPVSFSQVFCKLFIFDTILYKGIICFHQHYSTHKLYKNVYVSFPAHESTYHNHQYQLDKNQTYDSSDDHTTQNTNGDIPWVHWSRRATVWERK